MDIAKKFKNIRKKQGLTQKQFAELLGVTEVTVQNYEGQRSIPKRDSLLKLCEKFPNYADWLIGNGNMPLDLGGNIATINFLDVRASAGSGIAVFDERVIESIQVNIDKLKQYYNINYKDSLKVISASGDSMKPTYNDKDLILVDTGDTEFRDGLWVFVDNDELFIKRLQKTPRGITAISDNNLYPNFDTSKDMRLVAKAVGIWGFMSV